MPHTCLITFQIFNEPVDYQWVDKGRVNSFENADHVPQGGDVEVQNDGLFQLKTIHPLLQTLP